MAETMAQMAALGLPMPPGFLDHAAQGLGALAEHPEALSGLLEEMARSAARQARGGAPPGLGAPPGPSGGSAPGPPCPQQ